DLEPDALLEPLEPDGGPRDRRVVRAITRDPSDDLVLAHDGTREVESPRVRSRIERDRLVRNLDLGRPAAVEPAGPRVVDRVPLAVELRDVAIEPVGAHAVRVQAEEVAAAPIVERVDRHVEAVVLPEIVV